MELAGSESVTTNCNSGDELALSTTEPPDKVTVGMAIRGSFDIDMVMAYSSSLTDWGKNEGLKDLTHPSVKSHIISLAWIFHENWKSEIR